MPTVFGRDVDIALSRVVESVGKPQNDPPSPQQDVPYDKDEVKGVMTSVLAAVNAAVPAGVDPLDLHLVSVDAVRKTVDAYKTLTYEGHVTAYSKSRNVAVKLFVVVDVAASGVIMPRKLVQQSSKVAATDDATDDDDKMQAASDVDAYATFEPALRF